MKRGPSSANNRGCDLSIVIPALNEDRRIGQTLNDLAKFLKSDKFFQSKSVEVIVVAAGHGDKTAEIVNSKSELFQKLVLLQPESIVGKGRDVKLGVQAASGKLIVFMDADLATPLYHLEEFYELCLSGADIVIGTRSPFRHRNGLFRGLISVIGNAMFKLVSGMWVEDSQCGFKMFKSDAAKICFDKLSINGWRFDMELLVIARTNGLAIKTVRLDDWQDKPHSTFNENFLSTIFLSIKDLCVIVASRARGTYKP